MKDHEMSEPNGIIVFGPNASGKSTLGRELAHILGFLYMRHEEYHFEKSEIPYTVARSREDCIARMLADMYEHRAFVLSAVTGDFGEQIQRLYGLAVWIDAPMDLRMQRIEQRAYERHGDRVREGGDMYEQHLRFAEFAATRPLSKIVRWAETLKCPVIRVDGTEDWHSNAKNIANQFDHRIGTAKSAAPVDQ